MEPVIIPAVLMTVMGCAMLVGCFMAGYEKGYDRGALLIGNYYRNRAREHVEKRDEKSVTFHTDGARTEQYFNHSIVIPQPDKA